MAKVFNYRDFVNEGLFKKLGKKKNTPTTDDCVAEILQILQNNDIHTWDDFISSNKIDRFLIDQIIDKSTINTKQLAEVRFKLRLELSNRTQLRDYLKELEELEEYEKCALILKKMSY
jgi:hypothetical protein